MKNASSHQQYQSDEMQDGPEKRERIRLTFDLDVDVCIVGAGVAGLTTALECVKKGASVAVLEAHRVGWSASGQNLGTVLPGFGVPVADMIARVGFDRSRELWSLAQEGADYIRKTVARNSLPVSLTDGALEVSTVDVGDRLVGRLQLLGENFGADVEGWQVDQVRDRLKTDRYFHAIHYPTAFQIDGRQYVHALAALAENAGVRIFEDSPAITIDPAGIRKRVTTPFARIRCSDMVLAGNVHLGGLAGRLATTLIPVNRYAALTAPLGERLAQSIAFQGSVMDADAVDHFRIVDGDRLLWSSFETAWQGRPQRFAGAIRRRIAKIFPDLGRVKIEDAWSGSFGQTVHGMPQIGRLRPGVWVVSGFGRQGLNTSAMGGLLVAQSMLWGDERWKLFSPFELVWAGGSAGRMIRHGVRSWSQKKAAASGLLARYRERAAVREQAREQRHEERLAATKARTVAALQRTAMKNQPAAGEGIPGASSNPSRERENGAEGGV